MANQKQVEEIFAKHLKAALEKAVVLGIKASWSTEKHLAALSEALQGAEKADIPEILRQWYNISAYQQTLAKRFANTGHFQREGKKSVSAEDYMAALASELIKQG